MYTLEDVRRVLTGLPRDEGNNVNGPSWYPILHELAPILWRSTDDAESADHAPTVGTGPTEVTDHVLVGELDFSHKRYTHTRASSIAFTANAGRKTIVRSLDVIHRPLRRQGSLS